MRFASSTDIYAPCILRCRQFNQPAGNVLRLGRACSTAPPNVPRQPAAPRLWARERCGAGRCARLMHRAARARRALGVPRPEALGLG
jgi:hypothetical protein